jgi:hypothetical protein
LQEDVRYPVEPIRLVARLPKSEERNPKMGVARFELAGHWTARDLAGWLQEVESAYNRLNLFLSESLEDIVLRAARLSPGLRYAESDRDQFDAILTAARRRSVELRVNKIEMASPGLAEFIGNINPLKLAADFITAWRHENTIRDQNARQAELDRLKVKSELAKMLIEREASLRERAHNDSFIDRFVRFALDEPRKMLSELAKDVRLTEVTFKELLPTDETRRLAEALPPDPEPPG